MITYEELKKLPKDKEYKFKLFEIIGSVYVRITYNEDFYGGLYLDIMSQGYCDRIYYYGKYAKINKFYKLNKTNYNNIMKEVKEIKKYIINKIESEIFD
jgi:hypothetical protein